MLKHTRRMEELAAARAPRTRLVKMLGDASFAWCGDDALEPHVEDSPVCEAHAEALSALCRAGKGSGSAARLASQARRAMRELAAPPAAFIPPWRADSDSEADEAAAAAAEAVIAAETTRTAEAEAVAAALADTNNRDGLTPDWLIDVACDIFGLVRPCVESPIIEGLVDPCTNNKRRPNIPAEVLYDRQDDGLAIANSWAGKYSLLNPPYEAAVQWRFINRAINEVEWGRCPGILILCRNSTDTGYFQRLRPFPRCMLRRDAIRFKDYPNKTPIAFGICAFLLVQDPAKQAELYPRFVDAFASRGEVNLPIDSVFVRTPACSELLARLHAQSVTSQRDSWVCCDACGRWRELPPGCDASQLADVVWTCKDRYPVTGCEEPLSKREMKAFFYTTKEARQHTALVPACAEDQFPVPGHVDSRTLAALEDAQLEVLKAQQRHDEAIARALQQAEMRRRGLRSETDDLTALVVTASSSGGPTSPRGHHPPKAALHHRASDVSLTDGPLLVAAPGGGGSAAAGASGGASLAPVQIAAADPAAGDPPGASAMDVGGGGRAQPPSQLVMPPLTAFERQRLERIAANQERLANLLRPWPETPIQAATRREQHAAAAAAAARRVRDAADDAAARAAAAAAHAAVTAAAAHQAATEAAARAAAAAAARESAAEAAKWARDDLATKLERHAAAAAECDQLRRQEAQEAQQVAEVDEEHRIAPAPDPEAGSGPGTGSGVVKEAVAAPAV
jgi:hypothetical protein